MLRKVFTALKIKEVRRKWKLLSDKLSVLEKQNIIETRAEERFRLEQVINQVKTDRERLEAELLSVEAEAEDVGVREYSILTGEYPVWPAPISWLISKLVRKWLAGIISAVIVGTLIFIAVESIKTNDSGVPHAPIIEKNREFPIYDEKLIQFFLDPGEKKKFECMELWSAPVGATPSCATGFLAFTWQVREPFPYNRSDLEIHSVIPMGGGRTELLASGSTGESSLGYCSIFYFLNTSLVKMTVELRVASGLSP